MKPETGPIAPILGALLAISGSVMAEVVVLGTSPSNFQIVGARETNPVFQQVLATINPWDVECDPDTGIVYFSDPTAGLIGSIDPSSMMPVVTPVVSRPGSVFHGIALDAPNHRLFFLDSANDSVNVVDLNTSVESLIIQGGGIKRPNDLVYDPVRGWLFFSDSGSEFVGVIRGDAPTTQAGGHTAPGAWGLAVQPGTGDVYFSSYDLGEIRRLVESTGIITTVTTGLDGPRGLVFDRHGRLFCMESGQNRVVQVLLPGQSASSPIYASASNGRGFLLFDDRDKDGDLLLDEWERRFAASLFELDADSDPEGDGRTALAELLFNGTPLSGTDASPVREVMHLPGGGLKLRFEGPREGYGYRFDGFLSSDFVGWQPWLGTLAETPLGDPLFASWEFTFSDVAALGLDPDRIFARVDGEIAAP